MIKQAMILAAGMGSRMKNLVQDRPKPMLMVNGKSLIERVLEHLQKHDFKKVVINSFYKAELLENFVKELPITSKIEIIFSREEELLGPGGGIKKALPHFNNQPFFVLNSDSYYEDSENSPFKHLELQWNKADMLAMLLVMKKNNCFGYEGKGDFDLVGNILTRDRQYPSLIYPGLFLTDYRLFEDHYDKILQLVPTVFFKLMDKKKLFGSLYEGKWYHIGDKKAFEQINSYSTPHFCVMQGEPS